MKDLFQLAPGICVHRSVASNDVQRFKQCDRFFGLLAWPTRGPSSFLITRLPFVRHESSSEHRRVARLTASDFRQSQCRLYCKFDNYSLGDIPSASSCWEHL